MSQYILVYSGEGAGLSASQQLCQSLQAELFSSQYKIKKVDHHFLINEDWERETVLLVFSGGRDIYYHTSLQGRGNQRISAYVSNGGSYLGLCAGGYYGSASIEFEKGGELEVCGKRELAFFPGKAKGPAYGLGLFCYKSEKGARAAFLTWAGGLSPIYYNGGCLFEKAEAYSSIEVLARYHDLPGEPAAVVSCAFGKGRAILSGAHPEFKLDPSLELERRAFWNYLLTALIKN